MTNFLQLINIKKLSDTKKLNLLQLNNLKTYDVI